MSEKLEKLSDELKKHLIDPEMVKQEVHNILAEMSEDVIPNVPEEAPPFTVATSGKLAGRRSQKQIEVVPGVMVSQHLIDAAVEATTTVTPEWQEDTYLAEMDKQRERAKKLKEEIREDLQASHKLVQEMVDRMRNPAKYDEKYVSYDQMPPPLQRVIAAYIAVNEANKELDEALRALPEGLKPAAKVA